MNVTHKNVMLCGFWVMSNGFMLGRCKLKRTLFFHPHYTGDRNVNSVVVSCFIFVGQHKAVELALLAL